MTQRVPAAHWRREVAVAIVVFPLLLLIAYVVLQALHHLGFDFSEDGDFGWGEAVRVAFFGSVASAGGRIGESVRARRRAKRQRVTTDER